MPWSRRTTSTSCVPSGIVLGLIKILPGWGSLCTKPSTYIIWTNDSDMSLAHLFRSRPFACISFTFVAEIPGSKLIVNTLFAVNSLYTLGTDTLGLFSKIFLHLLQLAASFTKSSSYGSLVWNSSGNHPYLKSGKIFMATLVANWMRLRSPWTFSLIHMCCTLTATVSPVDLKTALWTYPKLALATGSSANSEYTSSSFFPNSDSTISLTSEYLVLGACMSMGSNDTIYSFGTKLSNYPIIYPSLIYGPPFVLKHSYILWLALWCVSVVISLIFMAFI